MMALLTSVLRRSFIHSSHLFNGTALPWWQGGILQCLYASQNCFGHV